MAKEQTVWTPQSPTTGATPQIGDQFIAMGQQTLALRRPYLEVSALMAQMYALTMLLWVPFTLWIQWSDVSRPPESESPDILFQVLFTFAPVIAFGPFLVLNMRRLKMSHIYFNRRTQHIYGKEGHRLYEGIGMACKPARVHLWMPAT